MDDAGCFRPPETCRKPLLYDLKTDWKKGDLAVINWMEYYYSHYLVSSSSTTHLGFIPYRILRLKAEPKSTLAIVRYARGLIPVLFHM